MPSNISHALFAEDVISSVLGRGYFLKFCNEVTFGAQGPDFFYHNRRTKPSCVMFGSLIHKKGYGSLVAEMIKVILKGTDPDSVNPAESSVVAYVLGFTTHAFLDRKLHPYINCRAGWVEDGKPETEQFRHNHVFLERIIDVLLLWEKKETRPADLDFLSSVILEERLPGWLLILLSKALPKAYEILLETKSMKQKLKNAYGDAMGFYRWINRVTPEFIEHATSLHRGTSQRWLTLIHPPSLPEDIDFMNTENREWFNPCDEKDRSTLSVHQLYDQAVSEAAAAVGAACDAIGGRRSPEDLENIIGNHNLSDEYIEYCRRLYNDPLPLGDVLEQVYGSYT